MNRDKLIEDCRQAANACHDEADRIERLIDELPPTLEHKSAEPAKPKPDYYLTENDKANIVAINLMLRLAKLMRGRSAYYRAVGQHLIGLRQGIERRSKAEFAAILRHECGLGPTRAYKLMELGQVPGAQAKAAFSEFRESKAKTMKRLRNRKAEPPGEPE